MITLTASARFGYGGKQYIARIKGRHSKWTFEREFVGKKGGKRGEESTADLDEPGLYEMRDIDSKGRAEDTFVVLADVDGTLRQSTLCSKEEAMTIAKRLGAGDSIDRIVEMVARPGRRSPDGL